LPQLLMIVLIVVFASSSGVVTHELDKVGSFGSLLK